MDGYRIGYAMFHTGKQPSFMPTNEREYYALPANQRAVVEGYIAAKAELYLAFTGQLAPSSKPMPRLDGYIIANGQYRMLSRAEARAAALRTGVNHSIPKAPRRKGRNAISLRYNGEGVRISWQGQTFMLDSNDASEHERIINNVINMAAAGG